jgi:hypothetical protein
MGTASATEPTRVASDTGSAVEKVAEAVNPANSVIRRAGNAIVALKLGARLLPPARRLFRRYPFAASLTIITLVGAAYWLRTAGKR